KSQIIPLKTTIRAYISPKIKYRRYKGNTPYRGIVGIRGNLLRTRKNRSNMQPQGLKPSLTQTDQPLCQCSETTCSRAFETFENNFPIPSSTSPALLAGLLPVSF